MVANIFTSQKNRLKYKRPRQYINAFVSFPKDVQPDTIKINSDLNHVNPIESK